MRAADTAPPHLASLHGLRGMAALGVLFLHLQERLPQLELGATLPLTGKLFLLVDFFFLLSGMVLAHVYAGRFAERVGASDYGDFLVARVARCVPMVAFSALLAFAANRLLVAVGLKSTSLELAIHGLAIEAVGMSAWFDWVWLNPPSWSLTAEFTIYLAVPWLIWAVLRLSPTMLWLAALALPLVPSLLFPLTAKLFTVGDGLVPLGGTSLAYFGPEAPWFWFVKGPFVLTRAVPMFLIGLAIYRLWRLGALTQLATPAFLLAASVMTLIAMQLGMPRLVIVAGLIGIAVAATGTRTMTHRVFANRAMDRLGHWSLGVYLLHFPMIDTLDAGWLLATGQELRFAPQPWAWLLLIMTPLAVVAMAAVTFHLFEKPARAACRRWWAEHRRNRPTQGRDLTLRSPMGIYLAGTMLAIAAVPVAILGQGWLVPAMSGQIVPFIEATRAWPDQRRIEVTLRLHGDPSVAVPLRFRSQDDWIARTGPNRRNAGVLAAGSTVVVTLQSFVRDPGPPVLHVIMPDHRTSFELDGLSAENPTE